MKWITVNLVTGIVKMHRSKESATDYALRANKRDHESPAFSLWEVQDAKTVYHGKLWRAFGHGFDRKTCWNRDDRRLW